MPTDADIEREFADLIEPLRDERMEIDPFFARDLDSKVAAGFPREPRWRRLLSANPMLVPGVAASMLLAVVVSLALLSSDGTNDAIMDSDSSAGGGASAEMSAPGIDEDESGAARQSAPSARQGKLQAATGTDASLAPPAGSAPPVPGGGSPSSDDRKGRKVETSAALVLGAKPGGVQQVADQIVRVTDAHRGFVMTSSVDVMDGGGGASFELRVPAARLKAALADLSRIADVRERRESAQDITREFVSARSRLADARAERRGLLRQLERATTDAERESVKLQLRDVGFRIGAAKTDLARVSNRASYSNIAVTVVGDPAAGAAAGGAGTWTPGDAARDAVRVLEVAAGVLLIALAAGLPLALIAALALMLARVTQRRRRERLLDA